MNLVVQSLSAPARILKRDVVQQVLGYRRQLTSEWSVTLSSAASFPCKSATTEFTHRTRSRGAGTGVLLALPTDLLRQAIGERNERARAVRLLRQPPQGRRPQRAADRRALGWRPRLNAVL
jgi:hypothetical protein